MKIKTIPAAYFCPWCQQAYEGLPKHEEVINFNASKDVVTVEAAKSQGFFYQRFTCKKGHEEYQPYTQMTPVLMVVGVPAYKCGICKTIHVRKDTAVKCCLKKVKFERMLKRMAEEDAKAKEVQPF